MIEKYFYSPSVNAWFPLSLREDYEDSGSWPSDAKEYSADIFAATVTNRPAEKVMRPDDGGNPTLFDQDPIPKGDALALVKSSLRTMRAPMLDALSGIAGRAVRAGNDALAAEADALAELLLDITDDPALNAATTYEEMKAAGVDAYRAISATASPALDSVFKEITGA